jgi:hypothetical protein
MARRRHSPRGGVIRPWRISIETTRPGDGIAPGAML